MRTAETILGIIQERGKRGLPLEEVYRQLYNPDLYLRAYAKLYANNGAMTPGTTPETVDAMALTKIKKIIEALREERYRWTPVKRVYIAKKNGRLRPLGLPSWSDKLLQEVLRQILEAYYEPQMSPHSHGFRPERGCHSALNEVANTWSGTKWFLEGDISDCFDAIEHTTLVQLLRKKIRDERFLNLIWKLLRAGYLDLQEARQNSLAGTPQGGLASPILANVYLHELDEKVETLRARLERGGKRKHRNPLHRKLSAQKERLVKKGATRTKEFRELIRRIRSIPAVEVNDPNFIRIKYLRYADDWLIGICGPRTLAEQVKEELKTFLGQHLKLTLSEEKTHITHARKEQARFLGTRLAIGREGIQRVVTTNNGSGRPIKRRSTGSEIVMTAPKNDLIKKLHIKGFCTANGQPTTKLGWIYLDADQIVMLYNGINRGIQNYYRFADNFGHLSHIPYILKFSLARTLAAKYKCSVRQVFKRFGKNPTIIVKAKDGKRDRHIAFYSNSDWKKQRNGFQIGSAPVDLLQWSITMRSRSKLGMPCCICTSSEQVEMHHVRHIRKTGGKKPVGVNAILQMLNRKQIPVCTTCHQKIHRGDYDGMNLSNLAYNPYESEKRRRFRESCMR